MANERPTVFVLAGDRRVDQAQNLEKSAVFLLLYRDEVPREWGARPRKVPPAALHHKRIQIGLGLLDDDGEEANGHFLAMKEDAAHFKNPSPGYCACYELTAQGERWAEELLARAREGRTSWRLDALQPNSARSATPAWLAAQQQS